MSTFYVTTAIDYPNAKPHIGQAYEKIIADMFARWQRMQRNDVFFLTGTDEHGQKIEQAAKKANNSPQKFVDDMSVLFKDMCAKLNISFDRFIRTTELDHEQVALKMFDKVMAKKLIYKGEYEGLYCVGCEAFYLERELVDGKCPLHQRAPEQLKEESYFFKLSEFQERLVEHIKKNPEFILPESRRNEILNRLNEPLRDLSISRTTFSWGFEVPNDQKHVLYVWFDALLNYLTGIDYPNEQFEKFWPANVHVIGKDVTWFHTVIWPSILMAAELPLPKTVYSHGFLTVEGQKMSKTIGNVLDPNKPVEQYGADKVRYYLLREVVPGEDGDFSDRALIERTNADLADALGNLLQRTTVMVHKYCGGNIPELGALKKQEKDLELAIPSVEELSASLHAFEWHRTLEKIWVYIARVNKYVNESEPWKQKGERLETILYTLVEHLRIISILVWPFIPAAAEHITKQLNQPLGAHKDVAFTDETTGVLAEPKILFEKSELPEQDLFSTVNLKVAEIVDVQQHPNADKLYVIKLNAGEERQLVAGIKPFYKPEELVGKKIVVLSNLKPAKLRGVESQGMLLAAEKGDEVKVLEAQGNPGDQVSIPGVIPQKKQITIDDFAKIALTTKDGCAVYEGKVLVTSSGPVKVDLPDGAKIR